MSEIAPPPNTVSRRKFLSILGGLAFTGAGAAVLSGCTEPASTRETVTEKASGTFDKVQALNIYNKSVQLSKQDYEYNGKQYTPTKKDLAEASEAVVQELSKYPPGFLNDLIEEVIVDATTPGSPYAGHYQEGKRFHIRIGNPLDFQIQHELSHLLYISKGDTLSGLRKEWEARMKERNTTYAGKDIHIIRQTGKPTPYSQVNSMEHFADLYAMLMNSNDYNRGQLLMLDPIVQSDFDWLKIKLKEISHNSMDEKFFADIKDSKVGVDYWNKRSATPIPTVQFAKAVPTSTLSPTSSPTPTRTPQPTQTPRPPTSTPKPTSTIRP